MLSLIIDMARMLSPFFAEVIWHDFESVDFEIKSVALTVNS